MILESIKCTDYTGWYAMKVKPRRLSDDFICFVLPNKKVVLETMAHHLSVVGNAGYRNLTPFVRGKK